MWSIKNSIININELHDASVHLNTGQLQFASLQAYE